MKDTNTAQKIIRAAIIDICKRGKNKDVAGDAFAPLDQVAAFVYQRGYKLAARPEKRKLEKRIHSIINKRRRIWYDMDINIVPIREPDGRKTVLGWQHVTDPEDNVAVANEERYRAEMRARTANAHALFVEDQIKLKTMKRSRKKLPPSHPRYLPPENNASAIN